MNRAALGPAATERLCSGGAEEKGQAGAGILPKSRASWARLLKMVFELDPLTCARCGAAMKVIAVITAPALIDRLLKHVRGRAEEHGNDPFDARAPPAA